MTAPSAAARVYVAIGNNIDPEPRVRRAAQLLRQHFPSIRFSPVYRNPAFGFAGEDFLNAVAEFDAALPVGELIRIMHGVEEQCGRSRNDPKWAPRTMDIDLLLYGVRVETGPGYTLPRRDFLQRVYMLGPLADLAPDLVYPPDGPTIRAVWEGLVQQQPSAQAAMRRVDLDLNAASAG